MPQPGGLVGARIGVQRSSLQKELVASQLLESKPVLFTDLDDAVERLKKGEYDCIAVADGNDQLTDLVNNALAKEEMYYETWYADARSTAGIDVSYDDEGNVTPE